MNAMCGDCGAVSIGTSLLILADYRAVIDDPEQCSRMRDQIKASDLTMMGCFPRVPSSLGLFIWLQSDQTLTRKTIPIFLASPFPFGGTVKGYRFYAGVGRDMVQFCICPTFELLQPTSMPTAYVRTVRKKQSRDLKLA